MLFTLKIFEQARYKVQPDPTVEEVKKLCNTCRRNAKSERVLFHYNGHGVPKPTANGEIWVFNKVFYRLKLFVCFNQRSLFEFCLVLTDVIVAELYTVYSLASQ